MRNKPSSQKKLTLNRMTLRKLADGELRDAAGGARTFYVLPDGDSLRDYEVVNGTLQYKAASTFSLRDHAATPAVSANGARDGIVWVLSSKAWNSPARTAVLHAADASNIAHELWNSEQNPARDRAGNGLRFNIPIIVNGHVYIGAKAEVDVYGLLTVQH